MLKVILKAMAVVGGAVAGGYVIKNAEKIYSDGGLHASMTREDGKLIVHFSKNKKDGAYLDVPLVMYKGYSATLDDGTKLECGYGFYNRVRVILDGRAEGTVTFEYTGTTVQHISRAINVIGVVLMTAYIVLSRRRTKKKRRGRRKTKIVEINFRRK